jgi:squalene-associated FAD-dependent desaturase
MTVEKACAVIVGGGLAGLAAACELVDHGQEVVLVERRPFLGGRASSFTDPQSQDEVDNGQHVFLKCCTEYIRFLERLGITSKTHLQPRMQVLVVDPQKGASTLQSSALPAPLHLLPSFLRFRHLSLLDKTRAAYAMLCILSTDRKKKDLDSITFYDWLKAHAQSEGAIDRFWNLIIVATLNDDVRRVSADPAMMIFQEGFLKRADGANIGYATVGLTSLLAEAASRYVETRGGRVILGQAAKELAFEGDQVVGVSFSDGSVLRGRFYICAVPHKALPTLLPGGPRRSPFFRRVSGLSTSPIVNIHLWYDRPITDMDFAAFINSEAQWVFNKSKMWGLAGDGQYLDISLSGAQEYMSLPKRELGQRFIRELERLFPRARGARVERCLVVKQPDATFAVRPGSGRYRLPFRTPIENLFLAGDWTATGWPPTMESAVRSGLACAQEVLRLEARAVEKGGDEARATVLAET